MKSEKRNRFDKILLSKNILLSIETKIKLLFFLSLFYVILYELLLFNINAKFYLMFVAGKIFVGISYALLASVVFYFFIIHLPKYNKIRRNLVFINNKRFVLNTEGKNLHQAILKTASIDFEDNKFDEEQVRKLLNEINFNDNIETEIFQRKFASWYEYLSFIKREVNVITMHILTINELHNKSFFNTILKINDSVNYFDILSSSNTKDFFLEGIILFIKNSYQLNNDFESAFYLYK